MLLAVIPNKVRNLLSECKLYAWKKGGNEEMPRSAQHDIPNNIYSKSITHHDSTPLPISTPSTLSTLSTPSTLTTQTTPSTLTTQTTRNYTTHP